MAIKITVGARQPDEAHPIDPKQKSQAKSYLQIRRTIDGNYIIFDHPEINIVVMPEKSKIVAFSKDESGDHIYATQSRLFDFLIKKGVVAYDSVRGGNTYATLEATIPESNISNPIQIAVFSIGKFIEEERPYFMREKDYEEALEKQLLEPNEDESTELGEIPHERRKGVHHRWPGSTAAYGLTGMYRA